MTIIASDATTLDLTLLCDIDNSKRRVEPKSARYQELTLQANEVRLRLPATILEHYDPRILRGKRGAAKMRNGVCGGCFVALPSGQLSDMRRDGVSLQVCGYCSILLLPEDVLPVAAPVIAIEPVAVKKPRKSKAKAKVAAVVATVAVAAALVEAEVEAEIETEAEVETEADVEAEAVAVAA